MKECASAFYAVTFKFHYTNLFKILSPCLPAYSFFFFFACPPIFSGQATKKQKKAAENETARFRRGISIKLFYYSGEDQWSLDK